MIEYLIANPAEFVCLILGIIYIFFQYKGNHWMWMVGFLMAVLSLSVFIKNKHYGLAAIQAYQIIISIYGFWKWQFGYRRKTNAKHEKPKAEEQPITHAPKKMILYAIVAIAVITILLAQFNDYILKNQLPWGDALVTAINIVSIWLLAQKYLEQWYFWVAYDALLIVVSVMEDKMYFYIILCVIYIIASVFGYLNWKKMMKVQIKI